MMKPLLVEVVVNLITAYGTFAPCELMLSEAGADSRPHRRDVAEYPAEIRRDFVKLNEYLRDLSRLYRHRLSIRLIDAASFLGFYKSIIHRLGSYPAFIVEKKDVCVGWDRRRIEELIDARLRLANSRR